MKKIVFLLSLFMFKIMSFAQSNFTDAYDEEREQTRFRMERFHFTSTEIWMVIIGVTLFIFGLNLYQKQRSEKQKEGTFSIVLIILGLIFSGPLIIGLLGIVDNIVAIILLLIFVFIIVRFIKSMFN